MCIRDSLRAKAAAEDVLMESMIALWENRNRWKEGSNLHALLLTIIKNKSLNQMCIRDRFETSASTDSAIWAC